MELKYSMSANSTSVVKRKINIPNLIPNHKYVYRFNIKLIKNPSESWMNGWVYFFTYVENMQKGTADSSTKLQYILNGGTTTLNFHFSLNDYDPENAYLGFYTKNTAGSNFIDFTFAVDNFMLLDLTEIYNSGQQYNWLWINQNIPFFKNYLTIKRNSKGELYV